MRRTKRNANKMIYETERFSNIAALLDTCDERTPSAWAKNNREREAKWAGESYEDARELLVHGSAEDVKKLTPKKTRAAEDIRPKTRAAIAGYAPIVPRSIIGLPKSMKRRERVKVNSRVLTLAIDIGYACSNDKERIARRGRELCELIQGAELAGYRIALDVLFTIQCEEPYADEKNNKHVYTVRLCIKRAEQPLDIKHVCYPLIHASMLRQLFFDWYERYPNAENYFGYGTCLYAESEAWRSGILSHILKENERYIDLMESDFSKVL